MVRDKRWKYVHCEGFRPMLFDLETDPQELNDLGADPAYEAERARLADAIFTWARKHHSRITVTPERVNQMAGREPPRNSDRLLGREGLRGRIWQAVPHARARRETKLRGIRAGDGGRDRDRTCDPYHVKVVLSR